MAVELKVFSPNSPAPLRTVADKPGKQRFNPEGDRNSFLDSIIAGRECCTQRARMCDLHKLQLVFTLFGAFTGVIVGFIISASHVDHSTLEIISYPGVLLLRLLKSLVLPLVISSVVVGVAGMPGGKNGLKIAGRAFMFYVPTSFIAAVSGQIWVTLYNPGGAVSTADQSGMTNKTLGDLEDMLSKNCSCTVTEKVEGSQQEVFLTLLRNIIPENIISAYTEFNIVGIVFFSVLIGVGIHRNREGAKPLMDALIALNALMVNLVGIVIWFVPIGIMCIISEKLGSDPHLTQKLVQLGLFVITVLTGLVVHGALVMPLIFFIFLRRNPYKYAQRMLPALVVAGGTASAAAAMPVTLASVESTGVKKKVSQFLIPIGATFSMNGSALYEAVTCIFIAQVTHVEVDFGKRLSMIITACLASLGAGAMPEAGLVTLVIVMKAVGLNEKELGLILGVDWLIDRFRTAMNVFIDCIGCAILDKYTPAEDDEPAAVDVAAVPGEVPLESEKVEPVHIKSTAH